MDELEGLDHILPHRQEGILDYIKKGIRPEPFLVAILSNDLFKTYVYADDIERNHIDDYITFLTRYAPPNCFGSRAKVEEWIEDAQERKWMANLKEPQP